MKEAKVEARVTPEFKEQLTAHAAKVGVSVSAFLISAAIEKMYGLKPMTNNRGE